MLLWQWAFFGWTFTALNQAFESPELAKKEPGPQHTGYINVVFLSVQPGRRLKQIENIVFDSKQQRKNSFG